MRLAGAERGSRVLQIALNLYCSRVRTAEYAPRSPFRRLERRRGLAQIVERGVGVLTAALVETCQFVVPRSLGSPRVGTRRGQAPTPPLPE